MPPKSKKYSKPMKKVAVKKTYKKKQVRKAKGPSVSNVQNALSAVTIHHNKLLGSLFDSMYLEAKQLREFELSAIPVGTTPGACKLDYNTKVDNNTLQEYPIHLYDITQLAYQDGVATNSNWQRTVCLQSGLTQFKDLRPNQVEAALPYLKFIGTNDGGAFSSNQNLNKTMMEYANIRLDLYQRDKYKSDYTVALVKFNDETIVPDFIGNTTSGNPILNNWWKNQINPLYKNNLVPNDPRITDDLSGKATILWQKKYTLSERLNDSDSYLSKRVNIFRKMNKVLRYNEIPAVTSLTIDDPMEVIDPPLPTGTSTPHARPKDRIYLMIKAHQTIDRAGSLGYDAAGPAVVDIHSYNIYFKSKHVVPTAAV